MKHFFSIICHVVLCPVASCLAALSMFATCAESGAENETFLATCCIFGWAFIYGIAAGAPRLVAGDGAKVAGKCFGAFAFAGLLCGLFFVMMFFADAIGPSQVSVLSWLAMPFIAPWLLGALFARLLRPVP
jgi:hypothetical protein